MTHTTIDSSLLIPVGIEKGPERDFYMRMWASINWDAIRMIRETHAQKTGDICTMNEVILDLWDYGRDVITPSLN